MSPFPPTAVLRHRKENLKKCSLRGLEERSDLVFYQYPRDTLPCFSNYIFLTIKAPVLTREDASKGLFIVDATWRLADKIQKNEQEILKMQRRSIPPIFRTAYPRCQRDCIDSSRGLASVEAIHIAYKMLGRSTEGLLDCYYWKEIFFQNNQHLWQKDTTV